MTSEGYVPPLATCSAASLAAASIRPLSITSRIAARTASSDCTAWYSRSRSSLPLSGIEQAFHHRRAHGGEGGFGFGELVRGAFATRNRIGAHIAPPFSDTAGAARVAAFHVRTGPQRVGQVDLGAAVDVVAFERQLTLDLRPLERGFGVDQLRFVGRVHGEFLRLALVLELRLHSSGGCGGAGGRGALGSDGLVRKRSGALMPSLPKM